MKKQLHYFNQLLRRYNAYIRRRKNLMLANKNQRRQAILSKHIERLQASLVSLKMSFKKATLAGGLAVGAMAINNNANAQYFGAIQTNPYSLTTTNPGELGTPSFYDIDNDGDLDMFAQTNAGDNVYFENTGTATSPVFAASQTNPFGLVNFGFWNDLTIVDIDNDGDGDAFTTSNGGIEYQENTGTVSAPAFATTASNAFGFTYSYDYSVAEFNDLDNDGDLDLMLGNLYGDFLYYENTGSASAPAFAAPVENGMGLAYIGQQYAAPTLGDIDMDGDLDILAGSEDGNFYYYENTGTVSAPAFAASTFNPFGLIGIGDVYSTPTFVDLDADGDLDVMSHSKNGEFYYFKNNSVELGLNEEASLSTLEVYPNPSNGMVTINFDENSTHANLEVIGVDGKIVYTASNLANHQTMDVSTWSKGVYIVKVTTETSTSNVTLIVQ